MSAWDDYPWLADRARDHADHGAAAALDEIDRLRTELATWYGIAGELREWKAVAESEMLAWGVLADEGVGHATDIQRVASDVGCSSAQALRMLVRYGVVRYDEFSDGPRPCVCGQPGDAGTVHYTDKPCVKVEASEPG